MHRGHTSTCLTPAPDFTIRSRRAQVDKAALGAHIVFAVAFHLQRPAMVTSTAGSRSAATRGKVCPRVSDESAYMCRHQQSFYERIFDQSSCAEPSNTGAIPSKLGGLTALKRLSLAGNNISGERQVLNGPQKLGVEYFKKSKSRLRSCPLLQSSTCPIRIKFRVISTRIA